MELYQTGGEKTELERYSPLSMDSGSRTVQLDSKILKLTRKEFDLLHMLMQNAGQVVPRAALLSCVWGYSPEVRTRTLDVHILRLRKQLGWCFATRAIETVCGVGYRLQP